MSAYDFPTAPSSSPTQLPGSPATLDTASATALNIGPTNATSVVIAAAGTTTKISGLLSVGGNPALIDSTTVGASMTIGGTNATGGVSIGAAAGQLTLNSGGIAFKVAGSQFMYLDGGSFRPQVDNNYSCGNSSQRWSNVYTFNLRANSYDTLSATQMNIGVTTASTVAIGSAGVSTNILGLASIGGSLSFIRRSATTTPVTVSATTDLVVGVNVASASVVNLPVGAANMVYIIKDESGAANTNNITVTPAAGNIDGATTKVINTAYGSLRIYYNGTAWFTF